MKKKVLVIDDDKAVREALAKVLRGEGYAPVLAGDFEEALARFADGDTDLVLLDLNLPNRSGWDLFERFTDANPLIPVIIVTGRSDQCSLALAAGAGALLEKPVDVDFLFACMRDLLREDAETRLRRLLGDNEALPYAGPLQDRLPKRRARRASLRARAPAA